MAKQSQLLSLDRDQIRQLGRTKGFPKSLRTRIWQRLLDAENVELDTHTPHRDEAQVLLDTNRSFTSCYPESIKEELIEYKAELQHIISQVLRRNTYLNYYQGYHDVAQVVLLVCGQKSIAILERISQLYLRDFMLSTLQPSMTMLQIVPDIISKVDPVYAAALREVEPFYAISKLLTWWAHCLNSFEDACRMFDFLLSSEPVMILYTIAAGVLAKRKEIIAESDPDMIFHLLSNISVNVDDLITSSYKLFDKVSVHELSSFRRISRYSALRTFPMLSTEEHFRQQERDLLPKTSYNYVAIGVGIFALSFAVYRSL